jgi:hypothetical protein
MLIRLSFCIHELVVCIWSLVPPASVVVELLCFCRSPRLERKLSLFAPHEPRVFAASLQVRHDFRDSGLSIETQTGKLPRTRGCAFHEFGRKTHDSIRTWTTQSLLPCISRAAGETTCRCNGPQWDARCVTEVERQAGASWKRSPRGA